MSNYEKFGSSPVKDCYFKLMTQQEIEYHLRYCCTDFSIWRLFRTRALRDIIEQITSSCCYINEEDENQI